jgi:lactoylglutathione lyase
MNSNIALITILTDDVNRMLNFYSNVLNFKVKNHSDDYVELENDSVRFAICSRKIMFDLTGYESFNKASNGQSFELAIPMESKEAVDKTYYEIISNGAQSVKEPSNMPWGQRTAFFADPDGNVHEIFAD